VTLKRSDAGGQPFAASQPSAFLTSGQARTTGASSAGDRWEANGLVLGSNAGNDQGIRHRAGAGFWTDMDAGSKLNFHFDVQGWGERLPNYLDTLVAGYPGHPG
jgi:hypothetical protein